MKASFQIPLVSVAITLALTACTPATTNFPQENTAAGDQSGAPASFKGERYTLRPTDILRVEIYQENDFRPEVSISQEGDVILPLIGKISIGGLTKNEAQQKLTEAYQAYFTQPEVNIFIAKYAERKVHVDGMVGRAGVVLFPTEENLTIMRAIATAGGILPRGERSDVKLKRIIDGREVTITVDTAKIASGKAPDIELKENDYIYVRDSNI